MDQGISVVLLSIGMFLITFIMGYLPTKLNTSQKIMNLISIFGAGLLVGAALIVIVPEGMEVLYDSLKNESTQHQVESQTHQNATQLHAAGEGKSTTKYVGISLILGFTMMLVLDQGFLVYQERMMKSKENHEEHDHAQEKGMKKHKDHEYQLFQDEIITNIQDLQEPLLEEQAFQQCLPITLETMRCTSVQNRNVIKRTCDTIGKDKDVVDISDIPNRLQQRVRTYSGQQQITQVKGERQFKKFLKDENLHLHEHQDHFHLHEHYHGEKENIIVSTIGLVIHSIADGLALGASLFLSDKTTQASGLGMLIFFAILLHKAPAAIGFGTFLFHEGKRGWGLAKHLFAFTITCPLSACIGYFVLLYFDMNMEQSSLMFWVGILLLVSAGSFIYVATIHILPEVFCNVDIHRPHTHKHLPEDHVHDEEHYSKATELITILLGLFTPFFLMFLHEE